MTRLVAALAVVAMLSVVPNLSVAGNGAAVKAAARAFVGHPFTQELWDGLTSRDTLRRAIAAGWRAAGRKLEQDRIEAFSRIYSEELQRLRPRLEALMEEAAAETLSLEEIRSLTAPFDTRSAASVKVSMEKMMRVFRARFTPLKEQLSRRVKTRLKAELPR